MKEHGTRQNQNQNSRLQANSKMPSMMPPPLQLRSTEFAGDGEAILESDSTSDGKKQNGISANGSTSSPSTPNQDDQNGPVIGDWSEYAIKWDKPFEYGANMESDEVGKWSQGSYWWNKFRQEFYTEISPNTSARFENHQERDGLFSEILRQKPNQTDSGTSVSPIEKYIAFNVNQKDPANESKSIPSKVIYKIVFKNDEKTGSPSPLNKVTITFVEDILSPQPVIDASISKTTKTAINPGIYEEMENSLQEGSFPGGQSKLYYAKEPTVKKQVAEYVQGLYSTFLAGNEPWKMFPATISVKEADGKRPEIVLSIHFSKSNGVKRISSIYLPDPTANIDTAAFDKDVVDLFAERQYEANASSKRKLGLINGIEALPVEERLIVKQNALSLLGNMLIGNFASNDFYMAQW
jgi:hypothetical protein